MQADELDTNVDQDSSASSTAAKSAKSAKSMSIPVPTEALRKQLVVCAEGIWGGR